MVAFGIKVPSIRDMIDIDSLSRMHVVGIGGIGISAVARLLHLRGVVVTGSDRVAGRITGELEAAGMSIKIGHWPEAAKEADLVVYSKAVPEEDTDRVAAREAKVAEIPYSELLGLVSLSKRTIAITGTHGKTTTTAMIASIAQEAQLDPTAVIGSIVQDFGSNLLVGNGDYLITEADEYKRSFLALHPYCMVITNIDIDHLDYYKDLADIQSAFSTLTDQIVPGGVLVYDSRDVNQDPVVAHLRKTAASREITLVDWSLVSLPVELKLIGSFNQMNAQAAITVAGVLGVSDINARGTLKHFSGTWRRQEYRGETISGIRVYDDYGHNPTEIQANLCAMREAFKNEKIVCVFQPHLYSRTQKFLTELAHSFNAVDSVVVLPIYAAREKDMGIVSHKDLVARMDSHAIAVDSFDEAVTQVKKLLPEGGIVVTQGAGDGNTVGDLILA